MKLYGLGPQLYFKSQFNTFDCVVRYLPPILHTFPTVYCTSCESEFVKCQDTDLSLLIISFILMNCMFNQLGMLSKGNLDDDHYQSLFRVKPAT